MVKQVQKHPKLFQASEHLAREEHLRSENPDRPSADLDEEVVGGGRRKPEGRFDAAET